VYHDDGILDLVVGITVIMLALVMAFDSVFFIGLIGIPIVFYIPIKEQISIPRIGFIRFEAEHKTRKRMFLFLWLGVGMFIMFFLLFLLRSGASPAFEELVWNNEVLVFAIILGGTLFIAGRILNNARFVTYALIALGLVLGANFAGLRVWIPVTLVGVMMEAVGIYRLVNFLRKYPLKGA
jgi:hypothetical protein